MYSTYTINSTVVPLLGKVWMDVNFNFFFKCSQNKTCPYLQSCFLSHTHTKQTDSYYHICFINYFKIGNQSPSYLAYACV